MQWTSAPNIGEAPLPQRARGYWKARFSAAREELERLLEAEHTQLPPWAVVGLGTGIAAWFALDQPGEWLAFVALASAATLIGFSLANGRAGGRGFDPIFSRLFGLQMGSSKNALKRLFVPSG